jgi:hypothetical protein
MVLLPQNLSQALPQFGAVYRSCKKIYIRYQIIAPSLNKKNFKK